MSTVSKPKPPKSPAPEPDPFRYGWRYVRLEHPDGTVSFDQVPLTLEDVLHPDVGDFIVQSDGHDSDLNYLKDVFKAQLADDPMKAVISDCRVDWNLPGVKPLGPDVAVFRGIKRHRDWSTFDVKAEGAKPILVVEVTSPDTRQNDVVTKVRLLSPGQGSALRARRRPRARRGPGHRADRLSIQANRLPTNPSR